MSDKYIPKVGDRVRKEGWAETYSSEVLALDGDDLWLRNAEGTAYTDYLSCFSWIKVEPKVPLPERWVNVWNVLPTEDPLGRSLPTRVEVDAVGDSRRIAVIHIYTDADGVDHADIERIKP